MTRQYARAFDVQDPGTGEKNLIIVLDQLSAFESTREAIVKAIRSEFGDEYNENNIMITATHTHATPGGITRYSLYNVTTMGWHEKTYQATVDGAMDAVRAARADLSPGNITVSHSQLTGVGVNRSMTALKDDPQELKNGLVDGVDPTNVTFRFEKNGETRGVLNWYALHPTSLPTTNTLISSDNKGYAEWLLENQDHGVDHYSGEGDGFVAAFANANTGDVSPNTQLKPGIGPTDDPVKNMKIQGTKVADAVREQLQTEGDSVGTGLGSIVRYEDFSKMTVDKKFTGTGKDEKTCAASLGQPFGAGSTEDGGGGVSIFDEGLGANKFFAAMTRAAYNISPELEKCQAPKDNLMAVGIADAVQQKLPVQIMRFGDYYVLGMPGELTGAVGVQYRQDAAKIFGVDESHIIIQGYTNAYSHYVTTPEEYDTQQYEGGATVFGRYTAPAFRQVLEETGTALRDGKELSLGEKPKAPSVVNSAQGKVLYDLPGAGMKYGQQTVAPASSVQPGESVSAEFVGAHPNNNLRHNDSYLLVERWNGESWDYVTSDNDPDGNYLYVEASIGGAVTRYPGVECACRCASRNLSFGVPRGCKRWWRENYADYRN